MRIGYQERKINKIPGRCSDHPPGILFSLAHPVIDGLQYILLDALPGVRCGLADLCAGFLVWADHDIVTAPVVFNICPNLCGC